MQKRILVIITILTSFYFINSSCSKLDTTDIGSDLLPAVDNVHTFAAEFPIITTQGIFNDSTTIITHTEDHVLGKINNDPLFGTTTANVYAQFKPSFYPFYWGNAGDTIVSFDSVILCLSYKGYWGDSLTPLQLEVREVAPGGLWDSVAQSRPTYYTPNTGAVVGSATIDLTKVGNYVRYANKKDSARNHIRIKLSSAYANSLFARDTMPTGNNTFRTDSAFKVFQKGLAIVASGTGNCLMYTNLTDEMSRLEVHYKRKNSSGVVDSSFTSLRMIASATTNNMVSVTANSVLRNRAGAQISAPGTDYLYLQTSPGTFANLRIPALDTLSNRIIHRAEIIMDQVTDNPNLDSAFTSPDFLYLDLIDTLTATVQKWKPIYFDLNYNTPYDPDFKTASYFPSGGIDYFTFGGFTRFKTDGLGSRRFYNFNITRHVQQIVTKDSTNKTFRLFAPYSFAYLQYFENYIPGNNRIAKGRVRLGSGTNTNPNLRMRLRIIYSNI